MQQRRLLLIIVIAILVLAMVGLLGLSYVYTPGVTQQTESIELPPDNWNKVPDKSDQPIEYP